MNRIKINLPENELFVATLPVRITDINYGNHLGNNQLVGLLHEARVQWLVSRGYSELNAGGTALIMGDIAVSFKLETHYGDVLQIHILNTPADVSASSFDLYYKVTQESKGKYNTVALAKTGMVCYDYEKKKPSLMPNGLKKLLGVDV